MKAIITGITGQDGAYLSKLLLGEGVKVFGVIRNLTDVRLEKLKFLGIDNQIELISADLIDLSNVIRIIEDVQPDQIYNLASQSSVGVSFQQPIGTFQFNTLSTMNFLEAMRILGSSARFYQASSSEMYGIVRSLPVIEGMPLHPVSPYGISKAAAHWLTVNYRETYGLYCCCGILFNHESVLRGENFVTKKIISTAVRISKGESERLTVGNTKIRRDWGLASEYVKAMRLMLCQDTPEDYIIASGKSSTLENFIELAFEYVGLDWTCYTDIDEKLYRKSEIDDIYGDPGKAEKMLDWQYDLDFRTLVRRLIDDEMQYQTPPPPQIDPRSPNDIFSYKVGAPVAAYGSGCIKATHSGFSVSARN